MCTPHTPGCGITDADGLCAGAPLRNAAVLVGLGPPSLVEGLEPDAVPRYSDLDLEELATTVQRGLPKGWNVLAATPEPEDLLEVIGRALKSGAERLVVVPMLPQFSQRSTGRLLDGLYRCLGALAPELEVEVRASWFDDTEYVASLADLVRHALEGAHADASGARALLLPASSIGHDPAFRRNMERTARLLASELGWESERVVLAGCSRLESERLGADLGGEVGSVRDVAVVCAGLTGPSPEAWSGLSRDLGVHGVALHACNDGRGRERLARTLGVIIRRGRHPVPQERRTAVRVRDVRGVDLPEGLFMVGVSIPGFIASSQQAAESGCSKARFLQIKRPHLEVLRMLRDLRHDFPLPECWVFNTCHRFELYSWFPEDCDGGARAALLQRLRAVIGRGEGGDVRVVQRLDAWGHLLRTGAGLNSGLIGDSDVAEQLESGIRAAEYAGAAGARSAALGGAVIDAVRSLRQETAWGRYTHRYTDIAVRHLPEAMRARIGVGRIAVLGGSNTSAGLVEVLREGYGVAPERVSVVYRGNRSGPLMNRFLSAVGAERLLRVEDYHHPSVLRAVADADVAFLAGDHSEAVLSGPRVVAARTGRESPLDIVDFNSFGSIVDASHPGLRVHDAGAIAESITSFNERTMAAPGFTGALAEAEQWVRRRAAGRVGAASERAARERVSA